MTTLLLPVLQGTLPGFPPAPTPSLLEVLAIMLIIPAVVGVVIVGISMGRTWLQADRDQQDADRAALPAERDEVRATGGAALPGGATRAERSGLDTTPAH